MQLAARNEERKKQKLPKVAASPRSLPFSICMQSIHGSWHAHGHRKACRHFISDAASDAACGPNEVHCLQASVVNRDMVAVVTRGTMTDAEMLSRHPDASFLLALAEGPAASADPATGALDMLSLSWILLSKSWRRGVVLHAKGSSTSTPLVACRTTQHVVLISRQRHAVTELSMLKHSLPKYRQWRRQR